MRGSSVRLNLNFTAWGTIVAGRELVARFAVGEPPESPDLMLRVQVASDMAEVLRVEALDTACAEFGEVVRKVRLKCGADFSLSDVQVTIRMI